MRQRALVTASLCISAFLPSPVLGARLAVVSRGTDAGSEKPAAMVAHALREAFSRDERYEVVDVTKVLGNPDRDRALRTFQAAAEGVQKGRDAYDSLDLGVAEDNFAAAFSKYEHQAAYVADFKMVADALMMLGATQIMRHEDALATRHLEQAAAVYPQTEPDWRSFNPAMRGQFQQIVKRWHARPTGSLVLSSAPSSAEVFVDGRYVGVTPLTLDNVSDGRHFVRLEKDGFRPGGDVLDVHSREVTNDSATLRPAVRFDAFDSTADAVVRALVTDPGRVDTEASGRLGPVLGADMLFVVRAHAEGSQVKLLATLFDSAGKRPVRTQERTFNDDKRPETYGREVAALLRPMVGGAAGAPPPQRVVAPPTPTPVSLCLGGMTCRSFKTLTLSIGGGLGAVAVGVGISQWVAARNDNNAWAALVQTNPVQGNLSASGRNAALRGDILVITGAVLGGASALAYFLWDVPETSAVALQVAPLTDGAYVLTGWRF